MNKISDYRYEVERNEEVTLIFTPIEVGEQYIVMALDGRTLDPLPGPYPTFTFSVTKSPGKTHFGKIECSFPGDTPDTAKFESRVKGSGGDDFPGPTIKKIDAFHDPNIEFQVI